MNRFDILDGGKKFRLTIDTFDGMSRDSGDLNAQSMYLLYNGLVNRDGQVKRRGGIYVSDLDSNTMHSTAAATLHSTDQANISPAQVGPYLSATIPTAGTASSLYLTNFSSGTSIGTGPTPVSKIPFIAPGVFVVAGRNNANSANTDEPAAVKLVGTSVTTLDDATTVTLTPGSALVTNSSTVFTDAMEGSHMTFSTAEATGYRRAYLIQEKLSTSTLRLAEPYNGDLSGASKAFEIAPMASFHTGVRTTGPWGTSTTAFPHARVACEHGSRLWLGWTKEPGAAADSPSSVNSPERKSRLRWSGIIGSQEGYDSTVTASATNNLAITGINAWNANGYIDLNSKFGAIIAMCSYQGALVVWQEQGMTILHGSPTFSGAGSLDATTTYGNISITGGFAYEVTDNGIYFMDKKNGLMVYRGGGAPMLAPCPHILRRYLTAADTTDMIYMGSTGGALIMSGDSQSGWYYFDIQTGRWAYHDTALGNVSHPVRSRAHECAMLVYSGGAARVLSFDGIDNDVTDMDYEMTAALGGFSMTVASGQFTIMGKMIRPEAVYVTMKISDTTPLGVDVDAVLTINGTNHTKQIFDAETSNNGGLTNTAVWHPEVESAEQFSIKINDGTANYAPVVETLYQIVVEGTIEGWVAAS